jgi:hypothetical protein
MHCIYGQQLDQTSIYMEKMFIYWMEEGKKTKNAQETAKAYNKRMKKIHQEGRTAAAVNGLVFLGLFSLFLLVDSRIFTTQKQNKSIYLQMRLHLWAWISNKRPKLRLSTRNRWVRDIRRLKCEPYFTSESIF